MQNYECLLSQHHCAVESSNSTLQANFSKAGKTFYFSIRTGRGKLDVFDERGETTLLPSASEIVLNLSPDDENLERGGYRYLQSRNPVGNMERMNGM